MKYTINDFHKDYPTDDACLDKIFEIRYGKEPKCPKCKKSSKFHKITGRKQYACQFCGHQIAPCAGTVFAKSRTSLRDWFYAMYLFTSSRHGVPAKELERQLGVTYKTAWRMGHQLRELMRVSDEHRPLQGHVEIDETYIGGRRKKKVRGGDPGVDKATVLGMVERGGIVRTRLIPNTKAETINRHIDKHVLWLSTISTDEHGAYMGLGGRAFYHGVVNHGREQYRQGIHYTNSIEGYWSRLKNSIAGTHIHVSKKHLGKYCQEFAFRYNNRKAPEHMFYKLVSGLAIPETKH